MGILYRPPDGTPGSDTLWFYSERGLLSYLFHYVLLDHKRLVDFLSHAKNRSDKSLNDVIGSFSRHKLLTEFSLGKSGFGEPDGVIFTGLQESMASCIFIEGKVDQLVKSKKQSREPQHQQFIRKLLSNSKLERQLELRWRFMNALKVSAGKKVISERHLLLHRDILTKDRFYKKCSFNPIPSDEKQWRRVRTKPALHALFEKCENRFFMLAITNDQRYPHERIDRVRIFNPEGETLKEGHDRIFWMPISYVESLVSRV